MGEKQSENEGRMGIQDASLVFNPSYPIFKFTQGSEILKKHLASSSCFHCPLVTAGPHSIAARQAPSEVVSTLAQEK